MSADVAPRPGRVDDAPAAGRICYEAFKDIAESHGFPPDFPSAEFATQFAGLFLRREDIYSVVAENSGGVIGSNYINLWGDVAGIGPISVAVAAQDQRIGRRLMEDVIGEARRRGISMIRLVQDSFNMRSLALYASLGFDVKHPLAYMELAAPATPPADVRTARASDLDQMDALCRRVYHVSRKGECAALLSLGAFPAFVLDRGGVRGYLVGTQLGHGCAETDDDMLALLGAYAATGEAHSFVPLRSGELYRRALGAGHRNVKVMNLMALGPHEDPAGTWLPSVMF